MLGGGTRETESMARYRWDNLPAGLKAAVAALVSSSASGSADALQLTAPNGTVYDVTVDNTGTLSASVHTDSEVAPDGHGGLDLNATPNLSIARDGQGGLDLGGADVSEEPGTVDVGS